MAKKGEKILTCKLVKKLGLDKLSVITADMLDGYTRIGNDAFSWCDKLTTVNIPDSVTSIGDAAFYECSRLTSITIPNSVTNIGDSAFSGCNSLPVIDNIRYADTYLVEAVDERLSAYTIKEGTKWIGSSAFSGCRSLTSVTIPNSVTSIGGWAFYECGRLTSITIPNSVISIGACAFCYCSSLPSIEIPNSVTHIGYCAFSCCNFKQKRKTDKQGRVVAYKGFKSDLTCRRFQYKEGETYELKEKPKLCKHGFHACLNPLDCFVYYYGQIGKDVVFHEVYLEDVSVEKEYDSKVVAKKITIGREITLSEMADIASGREM